MTTTVRYTEQWNRLLMEPMAGCGWLDEDKARELFESQAGPGVMVVGGDGDGDDFLPRWVLGFGVGPDVRAQFFNQNGTLLRLVDYAGTAGRLRRWVTIDYVYPDHSRRWRQRDTLLSADATINDDGLGWFTLLAKTDPAERRPVRTTMEIKVPIPDSWWLERPSFGDWAALADPGPSSWEVADQPDPTLAG